MTMSISISDTSSATPRETLPSEHNLVHNGRRQGVRYPLRERLEILARS
jgi:hypothetical protein